MKSTHILLALFVTMIWGFNYVMIKIALESFSPIVLNCLRFFFTSIPAIFFVQKIPKKSIKLVIIYGLVTFVLQFILLFAGMQAGVTPGVASILHQSQAFFTILFAALFFGIKPYQNQIIGAVVAFLGVFLILLNAGKEFSLLGSLFIIFAAIAWSIGNIIVKKLPDVSPFSLIIWGSLIAWPLLLFISIMKEGPVQIVHEFMNVSYRSLFSVSYIILLSTIFSFRTWNWLLRQYPAQIIAPFGLLVPIFGFLSSAFMLHEPLEDWKIAGGILIIFGLGINLLKVK